ncbi:MAG: type IX secretion system sortase PorU [Deltaproteobacteria bacterium]
MVRILIPLFVLLSITLSSQDIIGLRNHVYADNSVLSQGDIYKLEIKETGIFRITYDYLKGIGINPDNIDPLKIQIFNNGAGRLKQIVENEYTDDLVEIPYHAVGLDDGKFEKNDYILFFSGGPDIWIYNYQNKLWQYDKNIYSNVNFCFLRIGIDKGKRVNYQKIDEMPVYTSDKSDVFAVYETDNINLLGSNIKTSGSGQEWYGDNVSNNSEKDFSDKFNDFLFERTDGLNVRVVFAGRNRNNSKLLIKPDKELFEININSVNVDDVESVYAQKIDNTQFIIPESDKFKIKLQYSGESGWVDKIEVNGRKKNDFTGNLMFLTDKNMPDSKVSAFTISNVNQNTLVWNISETDNIYGYQFSLNGNTAQVNLRKNGNSVLLVFDKEKSFPLPGKHEKVLNQNLHSIKDADMLIVYHKDFEKAAEILAEHRNRQSNLKVYAVDQEKVFNEFSCGKKDPTAIRDFVRMLKIKNNKFGYLLLMGDGSYDQRGIVTNNDNFITVFETPGSLDPINSYPTDDYFGMVTSGDGSSLSGDLDISVGRFPVRTAQQADDAVQKLIDYETNPDFYGDWVNGFTFAADDEDENYDSAHFFGAEKISAQLESAYPAANINKIYIDAYDQEQNAGGQRYPDVNLDINNNFFKGLFMFIYFGHGGPKGLAQERIMQQEDILLWNNKNKLPLLLTATCSFTGFDDPSVSTAGEVTFLKEKGGVISLITTVRAVYSSSNDALVKSIFDALFANESSRYLPVGDILRIAKNKLTSDTHNKRKFLLFGDPSMKLKFPDYIVKTISINDIPVNGNGIPVDTLSALENVKLKGIITDNSNQQIKDFNGTITITLFDKYQNLKTKANDHNGQESFKRDFKLQKNILFKGLAEVKNGEFEFSFMLPKDINYKFGKGKISYYAINEKLWQATGYFTDIIIGGTSVNLVVDNKGPEIELYMNDKGFASGGITNSEPVLLGFLEDESGINITGTGIGHDLSAKLSSDDNKIILNDFYQSELNNFRKGSFKFPLTKLDPGKYSVNVEAWDIFNNKSEKMLEFVVINNNEEGLKNVLNFPNPFSTKTNFRFEHDLPDNHLDVIINIFSLSGKLVKTIEHSAFTTGFQIDNIEWDGTDDFGSKLANGVYVFRIKVFSGEYNIKRESKFEKLVIIK